MKIDENEERETREVRSAKRTRLFGLVALGLGLLVAVGFVEIAIRVLQLAPSQGVSTVDEADFDRVPGLFGPGQDIVDRQEPALPHRVRINAHGYRGPEIPAGRDPGEFRVLAIGDSFTFGDFVDDEDTLPAQVEANLRQRDLAGCDSVRVLNAGVGGTTIVTHAEMANRGLVFEPDLVLLTFSENDVTDLQHPMWFSLADNRRMKSSFPLNLVYPVLRHTATWNFLLRVRAARLTPGPETQTEKSPEEMSAEEAADQARKVRDRERYRVAVAELRDRLAAQGIPLVFGVYPVHHALKGEPYLEQLEWAEAMGRAEGLPTVPLLGPLVEAGLPDTGLFLLPHDGHPNPVGYEIAADAIGDVIAELARADDRCSV